VSSATPFANLTHRLAREIDEGTSTKNHPNHDPPLPRPTATATPPPTLPHRDPAALALRLGIAYASRKHIVKWVP
jgi:hypothetical protein